MTNDVSALIDKVQALVTTGAPVDRYFDSLHRLCSVAPMSLGSQFGPGIEVYRGTKHHTAVPVTIEELWFPPPASAPLGRANRPGNPMFYCCSDPNGAFREIGVQVGQLIVYAKWVTTAPMLLHDLGYTQAVLARAGSNRKLSTEQATFYDVRLNDAGRVIRDFVALSFTEPTARAYPFTAAIAEFHLRGEAFAGLRYPAVSKAANVDNLALAPAFVRSGLKLVEARLVAVDTVDEDGSIGGNVHAELSHVAPDGRLLWRLTERGMDLRPGEGTPLRPGDKVRLQSSGSIKIGTDSFEVQVGYSVEVTSDGRAVVRNLRGDIVEPI